MIALMLLLLLLLLLHIRMIHLMVLLLTVLLLLLLIKVVVVIVVVQVRVAFDGVLHDFADVFAFFLSLLVHGSLAGSSSRRRSIVLHSQRLVVQHA